MPVRIEISEPQILTKINAVWNETTKPLAEEILNDCNQYCKEDTGALIASSLIHSQLDKGLLIWQTPYARRQYYEIRTAYTDVNPGASWRWAEVAKNHHLNEWIRKAQILTGGGNG